MRKLLAAAGLIAAAQVLLADGAGAGPWEDGMAAYDRGDYVPAMQLVRPLAQAGNAKAQALLGVMYRRGQGVTRNSARAFMWLGLAADRGDRKAKSDFQSVARSMTPDELSQARAMMQICAASDNRNCQY